MKFITLLTIVFCFFNFLYAKESNQLKLQEKAFKLYQNDEKFKNETLPILKKLALQYWINQKYQEIKVKNSEVKEWYEKNKEKIKIQRQVKLRHILLDSTLAADDLSKKLASSPLKERFAAFTYGVQAYSIDKDKEKGGQIGWINEKQFYSLFSIPLNKRQVGDILKVKNKYGWHVVIIDDYHEESTPSLEQANDQIIKIIKTEKVNEFLEKMK